MKRKYVVVLFIFINFFINSQNLMLDDVSIDNNYALITFHNYPDDISNNIILTVDKKENNNFTLTRLNVRNIYYIIVDNSGSILDQDMENIKDKVKFFLKNLKKDDLVSINKVNDYLTNIYKLDIVRDETYNIIEKIEKEGTYSRLYDAILSSYNKLLQHKSSNDFKDYNYYLIFFSDGEDINSENSGKKLLQLEGLSFFFFNYGKSYNENLPKPFIELSYKTKGNFLKSPSYDDIKRIFFDNENRYLIKFIIDREQIIKSKEYIVKISKRDNPANKIEIDLKKFFLVIEKEKTIEKKEKFIFNINLFSINLLWIILAIILILVLLIIFILLKKLFFNKKYSQVLKEDKGVTNNINNAIGNNVQNEINNNVVIEKKQRDSIRIQNGERVNQLNKNNKQDVLIQILEENKPILVEYKTLRDNYAKRRYNKFEIFHSQHTSYIDKPDKEGEEILVDSLFKILNVEKDVMDVESEKNFLVDENIILNYLMFNVQKIEYDVKKEKFKIRLYSLNENKDLKEFFKVEKKIMATQKRKIFGSQDAIIESLIKKNKEIEPIISNIWLKGELKKEKDSIMLITENPIFLDITISIKYNEIVKEYNIKRVKKIENKFYNYLY